MCVCVCGGDWVSGACDVCVCDGGGLVGIGQ